MAGTATAQAFEPRYIRLDANDNVAIVVNDLGLPAKSRFACGLELRTFVPQGHKVALSDIAEGAPIRRYNEVIGTAARPILAGEWVDEARIDMPTPPELDKLELATAVPAPQARSRATRSRVSHRINGPLFELLPNKLCEDIQPRRRSLKRRRSAR